MGGVDTPFTTSSDTPMPSSIRITTFLWVALLTTLEFRPCSLVRISRVYCRGYYAMCHSGVGSKDHNTYVPNRTEAIYSWLGELSINASVFCWVTWPTICNMLWMQPFIQSLC